MYTSSLSENDSVLDELLNMSKMWYQYVFIGGMERETLGTPATIGPICVSCGWYISKYGALVEW